jgi:hypothetical protein
MDLSGISHSPKVNAQLDLIETELKTAIVTAIDRLNEVLASNPNDTTILHDRLSDLHQLARNLDRNKEKRADINDGCGW